MLLIILLISYLLLPGEGQILPSAIRIVRQEAPTQQYIFLTDKSDLLIAVTLDETDDNKDEYAIFSGTGNQLLPFRTFPLQKLELSLEPWFGTLAITPDIMARL